MLMKFTTLFELEDLNCLSKHCIVLYTKNVFFCRKDDLAKSFIKWQGRHAKRDSGHSA